MITGVVYAIVDKRDPDKILYVGSTVNMKHRWYCHRYNTRHEKRHSYGLKVYVHIRESGGIDQFMHRPLYTGYFRDEDQLKELEEAYRDTCEAPLNMYRAHTGIESGIPKLEYEKRYYNNTHEKQNARKAERTLCVCGLDQRRGDIARHRKSAKHRRRMEVKAVMDDILAQVCSL